MKYLGVLLLSMLICISASHAFPIQTEDGAIKINGMIPLKDGFALDVEQDCYTHTNDITKSQASRNPFIKSIQVVDSDDRFINNDNEFDVTGSVKDRTIYCFKFDKPATQIKRIRIEGRDNIYSIPWDGVPSASSDSLTMRLYGVSDNTRMDPTSPISYKHYRFEIKVTNNMNRDMTLSSADFMLLDQFNYMYEVWPTSNDFSMPGDYTLLPNESVRYTLGSQGMSPLSRPSVLVYLPENLTMDLEGWY